MYESEIRNKMHQLGHHPVLSQILAFDKWEEPQDFYSMGIVERRALLARYRNVASEPTATNSWIWFGAYDAKGYPKFGNASVPAWLYHTFILPNNGSRIRGLLNTTRSDVNPYKYFKSMNLTKLEVASHLAERSMGELSDVLTEKENTQFENKVEICLTECKEYYMVGSPTQERDFMKNLLVQNGHMPIVVTEAMARSGLAFKD